MSLFSFNGATLNLNGTNVGNLINITLPGHTTEAVPTYDLSSTEKTYRLSNIKEGGECQFSVYVTDGGFSALSSFGSGTVIAGFAKDGVASGLTATFWGLCTELSFEQADRDDTENLQANLTLKRSGPVTFGGLS